MLRWLVRLLVLAVIAVAGVMIVSRLTNREEDFDDYDDLESGFDFQETPVEIEVPAEQYAAVGSSKSSDASSASSNGKGGSSSFSQEAPTESAKSSDNEGEKSNANGNGRAKASSLETTTLGSSDSLIDIVGIGPAFDARLKAIGINTLADLAQADANSINEQVDVIGGVATVEDWIAQAKNLISPGASDGNNQ